MRILVLANVPPGALGGAEVQALKLANMWAGRGHEVLVAGYANVEFASGRLRVLKIPTLRYPRYLRGITYLLSTISIIWLERKNFDLIYCRFLGEQVFSACVAKSFFRFRQPIVACPASAHEMGELQKIAASSFKSIWIFLLENYVACINAMTMRIEAEIFSLALSGPKISRIPNGVMLPGRSKMVSISENVIRLIFVGRLVRQKGVDLLLDALASIAASRKDFFLELVGDGPLRDELETKVANLGLANHILFVGQLPPSDVSERLMGADLFVLPSRWEGFPGALLEAFAHGLPAVVTAVSGSEDIVSTETGWVARTDDVATLREALEAALNLGRKQLQRMGLCARERIAESFEAGEVARRYEDLFKELVSIKDS